MDYGVIDSKFVYYSNVPFTAMTVSPAHLIKSVKDQKVVESLSSLFHFLVPSTQFLTLTLVGCLLYWALSSMFSRLKKSARLLPSRRKLQRKIVSFFFLLFWFFIQQFFEGNLNTSNVVVQTDELLYSKEQILKTNKEFCFWEEGGEMDLLKNVSLFYEKCSFARCYPTSSWKSLHCKLYRSS